MENKLIIEQSNDISSDSKIKLYKDIFWEEPWNEWFICKSCGKIYSKNFLWTCNCDNPDVEEFYKNNELKEIFELLATKDKYQELVAEILDIKVWFIWWWNTSLRNLNEDKLWLEWDSLKALESNILDIFPEFDIDNFYYFAEVWVKKDYRWNDIAWELYRENLDKLKKRGENYILVRTTRKTDVPFKWFKDNWYKEVYLYNDTQDRVILVYKI